MSKARTRPRRQRLRTSKSKQDEVVALAIQGRSYREIASTMGVSRGTVGRILNLQENQMILQGFRDHLLTQAVPLAVKGLMKLLRRRNPDRTTIIETLKCTRVFSDKRALETDRPPDSPRTYAYPKVEFYSKYGRWPTEAEAREFDKILEVEPLTRWNP